jgi:hypothetical protein
MIIVWFVLAYAIHELGHFLAAEVFGIKTKSVRLGWRGVAIVRERGPWFDSLVVAAAGPAVSLLCAGLTFHLDGFTIANLYVGLVNLIPMPHSDGDHILECLRGMRDARESRLRHNGFVDDFQVQSVLNSLATGTGVRYVTVKTQSDAERLYERILHAGGDTSRLVIRAGGAA